MIVDFLDLTNMRFLEYEAFYLLYASHALGRYTLCSIPMLVVLERAL